MKYIMYEKKVGDLIRKIPIIFPNELVHIEVARALSNLIGTSRIVGAGDCYIKVDSCFGNSTTIGIKSKPEDKEIINDFEYFHGIECDEIKEKLKGEIDGNQIASSE